MRRPTASAPRLLQPLLAVLFLLLGACGGATVVADGTPVDLEELVTDTMTVIEEAIPAHVHCLEGVTVTHTRELDDRAEYRTDTRTVVLRVPATGPHLEFSLAHEIAHHLEVYCPSQTDLRPVFLEAQGLDPKAAWFAGDSWEATPSEQFATAIGRLVTGSSDPLRRVRLTDEALDVVARWARDGSASGPPAP